MTSSSTVMASSLAVRVDRIWESERPVKESGKEVRGQAGAGAGESTTPSMPEQNQSITLISPHKCSIQRVTVQIHTHVRKCFAICITVK